MNVKKEAVWKALNDQNILKQCIPGCESFEKESDNVFSAIATNQIGPMNATFSGKVTLSNIRENQSYILSGEGQSPVGFANGNAEVTLKEDRDSMIDRCNFARQIATLCEFPNDKQVTRIKKQLNTCIREDVEIDDLTLEALAIDNNIDVNVLRLWQLVRSMEWDLFSFIERDDEIECYINDEECDHEGYVISNDYGTFKLVDRDIFSKANFLKVRD